MNLPPEVMATQKPMDSPPVSGAAQEAPPAVAASQTEAEPVADPVAEPVESEPGSSDGISDPLRAVGQAAQALESVGGQNPVTVSEIMPENELNDPTADTPEGGLDDPAEESGISTTDSDGAVDE
jgi:hypothetical protein